MSKSLAHHIVVVVLTPQDVSLLIYKITRLLPKGLFKKNAPVLTATIRHFIEYFKRKITAKKVHIFF